MPELMLPQMESFTFKKGELPENIHDVRVAAFLAEQANNRMRSREYWTGLIRTTVTLVTSPTEVDSLTITVEPDLGDSFLGEGI